MPPLGQVLLLLTTRVPDHLVHHRQVFLLVQAADPVREAAVGRVEAVAEVADQAVEVGNFKIHFLLNIYSELKSHT